MQLDKAMAYHSRISAEPEYLLALGRAVYNFAYLEWGIIWTIVKLSADGFDCVPKGKPAHVIARAFSAAIKNAKPPLSAQLRHQLVKVDESYRAAIKRRNKLFHAHPFTAQDGGQRLGGGAIEWPLKEIDSAAMEFEETAISCVAVFHGALNKERP
jgi:hypothetical protein